MVGLTRGTRVTVRLAKGPRQAEVVDERPGFYQCRFDDGASAWVDQRDVNPSAGAPAPPPSAGGFAPPPGAAMYAAAAAGAVAPPAGSFGTPGAIYPCVKCGRPGSDHFPRNQGPMHRSCAGLGPDELAPGWIALAYVIAVPLGCTFVGALLASIPYYVWRANYPLKAKRYNRHVWIAFGCSLAFWITMSLLAHLLRKGGPP